MRSTVGVMHRIAVCTFLDLIIGKINTILFCHATFFHKDFRLSAMKSLLHTHTHTHTYVRTYVHTYARARARGLSKGSWWNLSLNI